jgi:hypothetical protein
MLLSYSCGAFLFAVFDQKPMAAGFAKTLSMLNHFSLSNLLHLAASGHPFNAVRSARRLFIYSKYKTYFYADFTQNLRQFYYISIN